MLCLGARVIGIEVATELTIAFLMARFSGEERHLRRLEKVKAIEDAMNATSPDVDTGLYAVTESEEHEPLEMSSEESTEEDEVEDEPEEDEAEEDESEQEEEEQDR